MAAHVHLKNEFMEDEKCHNMIIEPCQSREISRISRNRSQNLIALQYTMDTCLLLTILEMVTVIIPVMFIVVATVPVICLTVLGANQRHVYKLHLQFLADKQLNAFNHSMQPHAVTVDVTGCIVMPM